MATATDKKISKTAFAMEVLEKNPTANLAAVNEAWQQAGHEGAISETLVRDVRKKMGLASTSNQPKTATKAVKPPASARTAKAKGQAKTSADQTDLMLDSPSPSTRSTAQGKTAFIKEVLFDNPLANSKAVNEAWESAGMEGTISDSLVNSMRANLGLTGNLRKASTATATKSKPKRSTTKPAKKVQPSSQEPSLATPSRKPKANDRDRLLTEVEGDLDRLIYKFIGIDGLEAVENALRSVRRQVIRSHTS